jgi:hypothetical protein
MRGATGRYDVVIEGFGLTPAVSPPWVAVGGLRLEHASFARDGRRITGTLRDRPANHAVIVDLVFARAEGFVTIE